MKSKRESKRPPVSKGGFETDQELKVGTRYHFVYTEGPGLPETSFSGVLLAEDETSYYAKVGETEGIALPKDRMLEVNEIIG